VGPLATSIGLDLTGEEIDALDAASRRHAASVVSLSTRSRARATNSD